MPEQTWDVEWLAEVLCAAHVGEHCRDWADEDEAWRDTYRDMGEAVLAFDWLADQRAAWKAEARRAALAEVAAEMAAHRDSWRAEDFDGADADYGRWDAWSNAARIVRDLAANEGGGQK